MPLYLPPLYCTAGCGRPRSQRLSGRRLGRGRSLGLCAACSRRYGCYDWEKPSYAVPPDRRADVDPDELPAPPRYDVLAAVEDTDSLRALVARLLPRLPPRERVALRARILAEPPYTLRALGVVLDVTAERARQIEASALRRLGGAETWARPPRAYPWWP